ncbi:hypothetical protein HPP92_026918 [Vanilla planifolia]|uniref:Uncharacterized protein n=1 Tax=Vanilla planifolia TaxID=51239 RepID=A0A835PBS1_VANPL|nr:hypothetical protein HPP92_026918 [Vanilla planifolia]
MKPMNTLGEVIEEAKVRTVLWVICIFVISYFLSHTSKSMLMNVPISVLILAAVRYLSYELEIHWKLRPVRRQTYLSHLEKKQLSPDDSRISFVQTTPKWRRKIDSPLVEIAIDGFVNKILKDFVIDLWYSSITPNREAPELMKTLILDFVGEISERLKEINLVELLTRDMVDLIGNQLDLYRRSQSEIGINVMGTLSFEERDERLKHYLMASKELHPALVSLECEHKVLQQMVGGILAVVLPPHEAQCQLLLSISRELLTCLVVQPVMNFASPVYVNELIEYAFLTSNENASTDVLSCRSSEPTNAVQHVEVPEINTLPDGMDHSRETSSTFSSDLALTKADEIASGLQYGQQSLLQESPLPIQTRAAEWALVLEAATKRRTQVLAPENLENMWTKGRNYKKKTAKLMLAEAALASGKIGSENMKTNTHAMGAGKELLTTVNKSYGGLSREQPTEGLHSNDGPESTTMSTVEGTPRLKRSNSTPDMNSSFSFKSGENIIYKDYYSSNFSKHKEDQVVESIWHGEGSSYVPKLQCRVIGAYFEKSGSKSFAVYSIAVTDIGSKTWFVKRRYRNFERLHRHLKDIPNYSLSLPPKRFLSSSIDDYFVHKRCILLDKYLQDLLSIANIAEQLEVCDFLSASSKNYSFGKATSVMKTLAVNVDDAMDDIVRQFKRKVVGSSPAHVNSSTQIENSMALPWNEEEPKKSATTYKHMETSRSVSDEDVHYEDHSSTLDDKWHSDSEVKGLPPRVINPSNHGLMTHKSQPLKNFNRVGVDNHSTSNNSIILDPVEDLARVPPEWTPPNVSLPLLNLVDNIFQLNKRGWLSRQVFWISKQILQLMMEDAIDDWILRQIHWLRKDEVIAQGIHWVQDILWPNGTFFIKFGSSEDKTGVNESNRKSAQSKRQRYDDKVGGHISFEAHLEGARRASDVKKMILGGVPTALVSLIGPRQYRRCAKDVYYFLQSSIFLKQLGYNMLELIIISIFPELRDLIVDIHQKSQNKKVP